MGLEQSRTLGAHYCGRRRCRRARVVVRCDTAGMTARLALLFVALTAASMAGSCGDVDCDALTREAGDTLDKVIRASEGSCTQDSDCSLVHHASDCHDFCSRAVLVSSLDDIAQTRAAINADQCRAFSNEGCVLKAPSCDPLSTVICRDGSCIESY
jgi:hypothetical protein